MLVRSASVAEILPRLLVLTSALTLEASPLLVLAPEVHVLHPIGKCVLPPEVARLPLRPVAAVPLAKVLVIALLFTLETAVVILVTILLLFAVQISPAVLSTLL